MARKKREIDKETKKVRRRVRRRRRGTDWSEFNLTDEAKAGIIAVTFFILAAFSILAMAHAAAAAGEWWLSIMGRLLGYGGFMMPLLFILGGYIAMVRVRSKELPPLKIISYIGMALAVLSLSGMLHAPFGQGGDAWQAVLGGRGGGVVGFVVGTNLIAGIGVIATWVVLVGVFLISLLLIFDVSWSSLLEKIRAGREHAAAFAEKLKSQEAEEEPKVLVNSVETADAGEDQSDEEEPEAAPESEEPVIHTNADDAAIAEVGENYIMGERKRDEAWNFPSLDLLSNKYMRPTSGDIKSNTQVIKRTLANFGIDVAMSDVNVGPTLTQYTLKPNEGVKLSKILALQNDLALALAAHPIRIEAPIPGKSLVGIEVPNTTIATVRLREILKSETFQKSTQKLGMVLGRDVAGNPMIADLAKMPHLLIAGATGSGKSVGINTILISLLYRHSPETLKIVLVDPKRVELSLYNDVPHLITPVITEAKKTVNALKWVVGEMDRRYILLQEAGKRDINSYNSSMKGSILPYIVVVIDELADLMSVAAQDVEEAIVRLAQMARAVGIHLVIATQRPSVDVITGLIKANITSRMAFAVASQTDSRTIIDGAGAEKLLGNGDMLFVSSEFGKPKRIQGALVEEKEVRSVTNFLKGERDPEYNEAVVERQAAGLRAGAQGGGFGDSNIDDDLFDEAKAEVIRMGKGSASLLQRRLRVGYARAARLLDLLEEHGIVGPADGSKPREVLTRSDVPAPHMPVGMNQSGETPPNFDEIPPPLDEPMTSDDGSLLNTQKESDSEEEKEDF